MAVVPGAQEPIVGDRIPTKWRGNTVMAIDYGALRSRGRPRRSVRLLHPDHRWTW